MSIYVILEYVEDCKKNNIEPNLKEIKAWKARNWRD